jgi:hypothetical protein
MSLISGLARILLVAAFAAPTAMTMPPSPRRRPASWLASVSNLLPAGFGESHLRHLPYLTAVPRISANQAHSTVANQRRRHASRSRRGTHPLWRCHDAARRVHKQATLRSAFWYSQRTAARAGPTVICPVVVTGPTRSTSTSWHGFGTWMPPRSRTGCLADLPLSGDRLDPHALDLRNEPCGVAAQRRAGSKDPRQPRAFHRCAGCIHDRNHRVRGCRPAACIVARKDRLSGALNPDELRNKVVEI